ncbi:transcription antitermination factor NusB [Oscillatoria sp. FACHB-1406]|uniref:transcription antitermination factor NusB n=1 Tax=Oscillatoria sp. FACHB-1406 TaxID=2692846 RepID=UPI0016827D91|nr:transcription antitermination factor NusB [Oscillatoria sp. FACHB-1406]MBD2576971.1 transcription antitermination protein NusB [Oscillatoria sp. FACHB-1406]
MPPRKQPRRISRELALLSLSQIKGSSEQLQHQQLNDLVVAAIRTLTTEINDVLETAAAEVRRSSDRILASETRASDLQSAKAMVKEAIELTQTAINRLGTTVELPEFIQLAERQEVRKYALDLIGAISRRKGEIEELLGKALVDWQFDRLSRIDRDILSIAVAEIWFFELPEQVAINEAVELAKRYSDEEGHRFINGVLRRVSNILKEEAS